MKPWDRFNRWYARKYVCPFWGHKLDDGIIWYEDTFKPGVLQLKGRAGQHCQNCGESVPDEDAG